MEGRAYLLRPDIPEGGLQRQARPGETENELAEPLRTYARESGLVMRPARKTPYTLPALEATEYAQQQGKFLEFHRAAYRAYWEEGKDLGDLAVLEEVARSVSLDAQDMREQLENHTHSATVMAQYQEALQYGIRGIPTFVVGNLLFTGAHPYPVFKQAMERYLSEPRAAG